MTGCCIDAIQLFFSAGFNAIFFFKQLPNGITQGQVVCEMQVEALDGHPMANPTDATLRKDVGHVPRLDQILVFR